ncbi:unnamed protein product, partial [Ectocarpus sp. 13 AM-2016]
ASSGAAAGIVEIELHLLEPNQRQRQAWSERWKSHLQGGRVGRATYRNTQSKAIFSDKDRTSNQGSGTAVRQRAQQCWTLPKTASSETSSNTMVQQHFGDVTSETSRLPVRDRKKSTAGAWHRGRPIGPSLAVPQPLLYQPWSPVFGLTKFQRSRRYRLSSSHATAALYFYALHHG